MFRKLLIVTALLCVSLASQASVKWVHSFETGLKLAQAQNKLVIVDFYADWCGPCKLMDREVWSDEKVEAVSANFIAIKVDIDRSATVASRYSVKAIPEILILNAWGEKLHNTTGYRTVGQMESLLKSYPNDVTNINVALTSYFDNEKSLSAIESVGSAYAEKISTLKSTGQRSFLTQSNQFFSKGMKIAKKAKDEDKMNHFALLKIYNKLLIGQCKSVIKSVGKLKNLSGENEHFANYLLARACWNTGDKSSSELYAKKVEAYEGQSELKDKLKQDLLQ
ncbi:thioredoxin family protein [Sediminitomix flava]|uniref:Thioredoxin n=1 Tax=Sediminitomix flava TaxID=379075 RepID=A0A315ZIP4_SEDFL|nr:thioredoxin family protein [Sediminitomix flava]PWJ44574.1 thioredoxin [Sediminitomix flava]